MIFEIVNTVLLLFSIALNIKILNIANKIQQPQKVSLADMAADMMSCDNCDARDSHKENNVSLRNIYMVGTDNENDNTILLENNLTDQLSKQSKNKEWTEIKIDK